MAIPGDAHGGIINRSPHDEVYDKKEKEKLQNAALPNSRFDSKEIGKATVGFYTTAAIPVQASEDVNIFLWNAI